MATLLIIYKSLLCIYVIAWRKRSSTKNKQPKKKKGMLFMLFATLFILITFKIDLLFNPEDVVGDQK